MVFSGSLFLVYFLPGFFLCYFISPEKFRNPVALFGSILFYVWAGSDFFLFLCFSVLADFLLTRWMSRENGNLRLILATIAALVNFFLLGYCKYADFIVSNLNLLTENKIALPGVILPVGISFLTFHKMSYIIDVYYKKTNPLGKFTDYMLYILLFPKLISGPTILFNQISDQIMDRQNSETWENRLSGFNRFCIGLARKVLIANVLGKEADRIFALGETELTFPLAWTGVLAYTFQIYFDFAGYSDMAIGLGRMMGFRFPENFNSPYISGSITEFWRRWHITLGNWMREYIYIPLGGNKNGGAGVYFNLWAVFLFSGLWHGASWTFVLWGAYHGFFISMEKLFNVKGTSESKNPFRIIVTFFIVMNGWVLFRADTVGAALKIWSKMYNLSGIGLISPEPYFISAFLVALFFSVLSAFPKIREYSKEEKFAGHHIKIYTLVCVFLFSLSLGEVLSGDSNPFIYFRF